MKIWSISDTHCLHRQLIVPDNIDCIIHAGDSTNTYSLTTNLGEFEDFLNWFENLKTPQKVLIAGNHDAWATKLYNRQKVAEAGIMYLENEYGSIWDEKNNKWLKIFGSPWTPTFGTWYFMKDRSKLDNIWRHLDNDIDILITHGPPAGILDLSEDRDYQLKQCGDTSLYKRVIEKRPKYHVFGHIHSFKSCINAGQVQIANQPTIFMNVSCVTDGKMDRLSSNGIIFEI